MITYLIYRVDQSKAPDEKSKKRGRGLGEYKVAVEAPLRVLGATVAPGRAGRPRQRQAIAPSRSFH